MKRFFARWLAGWRGAADDAASSHARHDATTPAAAGAGGMGGTAPMLDCESVMGQLWDYLDVELTPERMAAIRTHLDLCKRCYPQYEFERSFLDAVAKSSRQHSNLERLRSNLMEALEAKGLSEG